MVLLGIAEAAVGHHRLRAGLEAGLGGQVLGGIGMRAAVGAAVVLAGGVQHHQVGGFELGPAFGEWMLDGLVLADRAAEHDPLPGVLGGLAQRHAADADGLGGDQDALRIQAVQQVTKALAFLADAVLHGDFQAVDEHLVRVHALAAHFLDLAHLHPGAVQVAVEQRQAVDRPGAFLQRRGAGDQQHLVRVLGVAGPHLLAVDHVTVAVAAGEGFKVRGVQARVGLGHGKAGALLAADQRRQEALALLGRAEFDDHVRPEQVQVNGRGARQAGARRGDGLHHQRRFGNAKPRAAIGLRHGDAQPPARGHGVHEIHRKFAVVVPFEPVAVIEGLTQALDLLADGLLVGGQLEIHVTPPD
ncbi:MAG: hypothetical protein OZX49_01901 [Immundisolibacter sp.]|nr:hypothetical protein [Immundisolibacter sp.]